MMMVKEHFIEAYGAPKFTIGWGGSGGSYQQHHIADGYPGLLDGIMPARSFPDLAFGTVPFITDARLLKHYFDTLRHGSVHRRTETADHGLRQPGDDDLGG